MTGTAAETLDAIARQLGLRIIRGERVVARDRWGRASEDSILEHFTDRRGLDELRGSVDGVPLEAGAHPAEDFLDVFVRRSFALDMGLRLTNEPDLDLRRSRREPDDAATNVRAHCDEPARLGRWARVLRAVGAFDPARTRISIGDDGIRARVSFPRADDLRAIAALAKVEETARLATPMATLTAPHAEAWKQTAEDEGWSSTTVPLTLAAREGAVKLLASAVRRDPAAFDLSIRVRYRTALADWIAVEDRTEGPDGWLARLRDPIVVRTPSDVPDALPEPARQLLRSLAITGDAKLHDAGLDVLVPLPSNGAESVQLVRQAVAIVRASWDLATGATTPAAGTIYRAPPR